MSKRNIWKSEEINYFLHLMKEKKMMGLMDGKRLKVCEIYKSMEKPMTEAGFNRDAAAMQMKFKNLKSKSLPVSLLLIIIYLNFNSRGLF